MEQVIQLPKDFIYKLGSLLSFLIFGAAFMVTRNVLSVLERGPSMAILFANEYALTLVSLLGSAVRFTLNCCDILSPDDPFEQRSTVIFYLDFFVDLFKLLIYTAFFAVVMAYYGLPIHIIRDLYITVVSFTKRVRDMINYHQIMSSLQNRYPDVTPEELAACNDPTCIICREEMVNDAVKRLPCGHFFHFKCLKSWLERQQVCPTCRKSVLEVVKPIPPPTPIYPAERPNWSETNSPYAQSQHSHFTASQNSLNPNSTLNRSNSASSSTHLLFSPLRRAQSTSSLISNAQPSTSAFLIDGDEKEVLLSEQEKLKIAAELERIGRRSRSPLQLNLNVNVPISASSSVCPMSPLSHVKSRIERVEELMEEHEKILTQLRQIETEIVRERSFSQSRLDSTDNEKDD